MRAWLRLTLAGPGLINATPGEGRATDATGCREASQTRPQGRGPRRRWRAATGDPGRLNGGENAAVSGRPVSPRRCRGGQQPPCSVEGSGGTRTKVWLSLFRPRSSGLGAPPTPPGAEKPARQGRRAVGPGGVLGSTLRTPADRERRMAELIGARLALKNEASDADAHKEAKGEHGRDERGAAVGKEGQRHAHHRQQPQDHADVDRGLPEDVGRDA